MKSYVRYIILLAPLLFLTIFAIILGSQKIFYGYFGDAQMQIWQSYNLFKTFSLPSSILTDSFFGTPYPYALSLSSLLQNSFIYIVFLCIKDIYIAYNFSVVFFLYLNFAAMYFVLRRLHFGRRLSVLGGFVYFMTPSTILHSFGHPSVYITFIFPLFIYGIIRLFQKVNLIHFLLVSFAVACTFYIHEYYTIIIMIMYGVYVLFNLRLLISQKHNWGYIFISLLFIGTASLPFLNLYIDKVRFDAAYHVDMSRSLDEMIRFSSGFLNYFFPSNESFFYSLLPIQPFKHVIPSEHLNYLGLLNLSILLYVGCLFIQKKASSLFSSPVKKRVALYLAIICVIAATLSFGPYLHIFSIQIPLPVYYFFKLHIFPFTAIRAWGRYGIVVFTVATMFSVYVISRTKLNKLLANTALFILLLVIIFLDQAPVKNIPTYHLNVPSYVNVIKNDPDNFFVLHVPFSIYYGALHNATAQFFQLYHSKPIVNGYASFLMPIYEKKIAESTVRCFHYPQIFSPDCVGVLSPEALKYESIKYIVYEKNTMEYLPGIFEKKLDLELRKKTLERLSDLQLNSSYEDDDYVIYKVY